MEQEFIVSAAHYFEEYELIIPCIRHCDELFYQQYDSHERYMNLDTRTEIQGFVTNKKRFVDRYEGMKIAIKNNQIRQLVGSQTQDNLHTMELFSENLY